MLYILNYSSNLILSSFWELQNLIVRMQFFEEKTIIPLCFAFVLHTSEKSNPTLSFFSRKRSFRSTACAYKESSYNTNWWNPTVELFYQQVQLQAASDDICFIRRAAYWTWRSVHKIRHCASNGKTKLTLTFKADLGTPAHKSSSPSSQKPNWTFQRNIPLAQWLRINSIATKWSELHNKRRS